MSREEKRKNSWYKKIGFLNRGEKFSVIGIGGSMIKYDRREGGESCWELREETRNFKIKLRELPTYAL